MNYPLNDWKFDEEIETAFNEWFYSNHTDYSLKAEYFYGDVSVEDLKTREDLMKKWLYASFFTAYQRGRCAKLEETNEEIKQSIKETDKLIEKTIEKIDEYLEK